MRTNNKLRETLVAVKKSIDEIGASSLDGDPEILMMSLTQVCVRLSARIDAALSAPATAEKSSAVGNGAKLRKALLCIGHIAEYLEAGTVKDLNHAYRNIQDRVEIALAAPQRNCDVGTPKQQAKRFQKFCLGHQPKEGDCTCACPAFVGKDVDCHFSWAQMTYKEEKGEVDDTNG